MEDFVKLDTVEQYYKLFGMVGPTHPLVGVIDLKEATRMPSHFTVNYGVYALYLKDTKCGNIRYGRQTYDYDEGTVVSFAPGQIATVEMQEGVMPSARGILFHPDLIRGTSLGQDIRKYSFFAYSSSEALHLSDDEKDIFLDCLAKLKAELQRPIDKYTRKLLARTIELLLDYCMRFYDRQFTTRTSANKDVLTRFENLLDEYFASDSPLQRGLPTVKYFADKVCLSPNYFGDLIKKETGKTAQEYIQARLISQAKDLILSTNKTVSEIAYELGFQYSQHFNRVFKRDVGCTPGEYRKASLS